MHREERTMTTIYLIRHAEAEGNVFRRIHGQYDSCVTPNGRRQIAALAQRFAGIPVDAVYASDLKRTCLTATAIYRQKGLPLHRDARFREVGLGPWEDTPFGELERRYPAQLHAFSHDSYHWYVEGAECFLQYAHRFLAGLDDVVRRHEGQSIAIFSHGMVLRGALIELFFPGQDEGVSHSENTAVTELMLSSVGAKTVLAAKSQNRQNTAPPRKQPGIMSMGFAVLNRLFTRCGTAIPTKEIGPAKAVTQADSRLDSRISNTRSRRILTPMFLAYASPI